MKKNIVIVSIMLLIALHLFVVYAQDIEKENDANVPPGMVMKRIKGRYMIIPKDSWVHKRGDLLVMEDINAYVARKIMEIEKRLEKIDADLEAIHKGLRESKNSV